LSNLALFQPKMKILKILQNILCSAELWVIYPFK